MHVSAAYWHKVYCYLLEYFSFWLLTVDLLLRSQSSHGPRCRWWIQHACCGGGGYSMARCGGGGYSRPAVAVVDTAGLLCRWWIQHCLQCRWWIQQAVAVAWIQHGLTIGKFHRLLYYGLCTDHNGQQFRFKRKTQTQKMCWTINKIGVIQRFI